MMPAEVDGEANKALAQRRRRQRSIALAVALAAFVVIIYVLTFGKRGIYHQL
jgi:ferric-dicitrate binding protein FerR (iron transport regulator)